MLSVYIMTPTELTHFVFTDITDVVQNFSVIEISFRMVDFHNDLIIPAHRLPYALMICVSIVCLKPVLPSVLFNHM